MFTEVEKTGFREKVRQKPHADPDESELSPWSKRPQCLGVGS